MPASFRSPARWAPWLLVMVLALPACGTSHAVTRVVDGHEIEGRFVRSDAYALFLQGVIAERSGHLAAAERLYIEAYRRDADGVAILVRLGAVRCAWGPRGHAPAEQTFEEALEIDFTYAPIHLERARCALRRHAPDEAVRHAQRAMENAPFDIETTLVLAEALEKAGRDEEAARVLDGMSLVSPSEQVRRARKRLAGRGGDDAARLLTQRIDASIVQGDLDEARALASEAGMDQGLLAVRAAALGKWRVARRQAFTVLAAEPGHPDATAAWLASPGPQSAYASVDPSIWRRLLRKGNSERRLSSLGALVLADALQRRFGPQVAADWLVFAPPGGDEDVDPLAASLRKRLAPLRK